MNRLFFNGKIFIAIILLTTPLFAQQPGVSLSEKNISTFHPIESQFAEPDYSKPHSKPMQVTSIYTVTNTNDDAANGSLRWAITQANANPGQDVITFAIGNGPQTISVKGNLPFITDPVIIDGTTQPGYSGKPIIVLNGAGSNDYGLRVTKGPSTVRGLVINGFPLGGMTVGSAQFQRNDSITVEGCYIGTDVTGTIAVPNGGGTNSSSNEGGISVFFSGNNTIGGKTTETHNLISGNKGPGITVNGSTPTGCILDGNIVGLDATGIVALPNHGPGILLLNTNHQTIGDTAQGASNYVSGNMSDGIELRHSSVFTNRIRANVIGLDEDGLQPIPNGSAGIFINGSPGNRIGGLERKYGNLISGNNIGIRLDSGATTDTIISNHIGGDAADFGTLGNTTDGILVSNSSGNMIGSTDLSMGNVIRYNKTGITIQNSSGVTILGNSVYSNAQGGIKLINANNMQAAPKLDSAMVSGGNTTVYGKLHSQANRQYRIEYFKNEKCPPSSGGEGQFFLGMQNVTTDASGNVLLSFTAPGMLEDSSITSTATDTGGNTSQFSPCLCCAEIRIAFTPAGNGFRFNNSDSNLWAPAYWVDYLDGKHTGLLAELRQIGYDTIPSADIFPSWDTWADAFGEGAVYLRTPPNAIYSRLAVVKWKSNWQHWHGSCEGFSVASMLEMLDNSTFPKGYLQVPANDTIAEIINKYYVYQYSAEGIPYLYYPNNPPTPVAMVDSMRRSLKRDPSRYQPVGIFLGSGTNVSGHSLVVYRIKCDTSSEGRIDSLFVYDSNHPGDSTRAIAIWRDDPVQTWAYQGFGIGAGKGFQPDFEIGNFAHGKRPTLPAAAPTGKHPNPLAADPSSTINFGDSAIVSVSDKTGHAISTSDSLNGNLPNVGYIIPKTGGISRIMGFHFLQNDPDGWTVSYKPQNAALQNFLSIGSSTLTTYAHFAQNDMSAAQKFKVNVADQSFSMKAGAPSANFGLSMIWNANGGENSVDMLNSTLAKNDSLRFQFTNRFTFLNAGSAKEYILNLRHATPNGEVIKNFGPIGAGTSELATLVVGNWDSLGSTPIRIDIDKSNNGSIDTTIILQNGASGVSKRGANSLRLAILGEPRDPRITIEYTLPVSGNDKIIIYDLVGREVYRISERMEAAGTYHLLFDRNQLLGGSYFILLHTSEGNVMQKMVWTR